MTLARPGKARQRFAKEAIVSGHGNGENRRAGPPREVAEHSRLDAACLPGKVFRRFPEVTRLKRLPKTTAGPPQVPEVGIDPA